MANKLILKILIAASFLNFYFCSKSCAEESKDECLKNFDLDAVIQEHKGKKNEISSNFNLLLDYFQCQAAVDDSANVCNSLKEEGDQKKCRQHFNAIQGFFGRLIYDKKANLSTLSACVDSGGKNKTMESCKKHAEAFLNNDVETCKQSPTPLITQQCTAVFSLDPSRAPDPATADTIHYINALKTLTSQPCANIADKTLKRECQALVARDKKICQETKGYKEFRKFYCQKFHETEKIQKQLNAQKMEIRDEKKE